MSKKGAVRSNVKLLELQRIALEPLGTCPQKSLGPKSAGAFRIRKIEKTKFRYFCKSQDGTKAELTRVFR